MQHRAMRNVDLIMLVRMLAIGVIVMCFQAAMTGFQRRRGKAHEGWRYLTPAPIVWIALVGGAALTTIFTLVAIGGGERASGLSGLAIFFNLATLVLAYSIFAEQVRWNETHIERRTILFQTRSITWHELASVGYEPTGYWWVRGFDGPRIRFSPQTHGFDELMLKIVDNLPPDGPPPEIASALNAVLVRATRS
jgi:hypothetical protein